MSKVNITIVPFQGFFWSLDTDIGKIVGKDNCGFPIHEFWVSDSPQEGTKRHKLFAMVCELAVDAGLIRRLTTYALVEK